MKKLKVSRETRDNLEKIVAYDYSNHIPASDVEVLESLVDLYTEVEGEQWTNIYYDTEKFAVVALGRYASKDEALPQKYTANKLLKYIETVKLPVGIS